MVLPLIGSLLAPTLFAGAVGLSAATLAGLGAGLCLDHRKSALRARDLRISAGRAAAAAVDSPAGARSVQIGQGAARLATETPTRVADVALDLHAASRVTLNLHDPERLNARAAEPNRAGGESAAPALS